MEALETLKHELLTQKSVIEGKGGTVNSQHLNPSPSEITSGISSIIIPNLTESNAVEADVLQGKTFYSGDAVLKTGSYVPPTASNGIDIYFLENQTGTDLETKTFSLPQELKVLRDCAFMNLTNPIMINLNSALEEIGVEAFAKTSNISITSLNTLPNLKVLGESSFFMSEIVSGLDLNNIPSTLVNIGAKSFYGTSALVNSTFVIPAVTTNVGIYAFANSTRINANSLTIEDDGTNTGITFSTSSFEYLQFQNPLNVPSRMSRIPTNFNYRGGFPSVTIPSTCTYIGDMAFGGGTSDAESFYYMTSVTINAVTPPTFGLRPFAIQNINKGLKIYVPDESVEAYKAVTNIKSYYLNCITPMSQKP